MELETPASWEGPLGNNMPSLAEVVADLSCIFCNPSAVSAGSCNFQKALSPFIFVSLME